MCSSNNAYGLRSKRSTTTETLTYDFRDNPQFVQERLKQHIKSGPDHFSPHPFEFTFHYRLVPEEYTEWFMTSCLNYTIYLLRTLPVKRMSYEPRVDSSLHATFELNSLQFLYELSNALHISCRNATACVRATQPTASPPTLGNCSEEASLSSLPCSTDRSLYSKHWPPRSPDINRLDSNVWWQIADVAYQQQWRHEIQRSVTLQMLKLPNSKS